MSKKLFHKRTILIVIGCIVILLGLIGTGVTLYNQPQKTGNFTQNPDAYLMDFEILQGKFAHVIDLQEGDILVVHLEKDKGSFDVDVALQTIIGEDIEVLSSIYSGNDVTGGDFELPIDKSGAYKITVNGHHAKGVANFYVKDR